MTNEYWVIRRSDGTCWTGLLNLFSPNRLLAERFLSRPHPRLARACNGRIVHVRVRPRSERLYLAARLAAWEATVKAAQEWAASWQTTIAVHRARRLALAIAVRAIPEEHRL